MFVKPAAGLKVRDYRTRQFIPEGGIDVPDDDQYWLQRVAQGDVIRVATSTKPKIAVGSAGTPGSLKTGDLRNSSPSEEQPQ